MPSLLTNQFGSLESMATQAGQTHLRWRLQALLATPQIQTAAIGLGGGVENLRQGEIDARRGADKEQAGFSRAWEHFSRRAGRIG